MRLNTRPLIFLALFVGAVSGLAQSPPPAAPAAPPQTISLPTFTATSTVSGTNYTYTLIGGDPARGGTTTIPTVLVPITLTIEAPMDAAGNRAVLDAAPIARQVVGSPIFAKYAFASGTTQYADALMRADFYKESGGGDWHTLLGQPKMVSVKISVPIGFGYVLTSKRTGRRLAMVDLRFMQEALFKHLPKAAAGAGALVIAVARDTTYYVNADATQCCRWAPTASIPPRVRDSRSYSAPSSIRTSSRWTPMCSPSRKCSRSSFATRCTIRCIAARAERRRPAIFFRRG
jgi:hypothetical protein